MACERAAALDGVGSVDWLAARPGAGERSVRRLVRSGVSFLLRGVVLVVDVRCACRAAGLVRGRTWFRWSDDVLSRPR